jgi:hypothetical protein
VNIFFGVWFFSRKKDISFCTKDISSVKFWYFYKIFAGRTYISYRRRYSSGSVDILSILSIIWSEWIRARAKNNFVQQKIFQNILLSLHPLLQKNFGRFFLGVVDKHPKWLI